MSGNGTTGPAAELSNNALPGTQFYAPRARLLDAATGEPVTVNRRPVHADIKSVRLVQTHSGVSQATITLNNQRHHADSPYNPLVPTWLYNDFDEIKFGSELKLQLGYAEQWQDMIVIRVTDIAFKFPSQGGAQVVIQGEDKLSLLKTNPDEDHRYRSPNAKELAMVRDVLQRAGGALTLAGSAAEPFSDSLNTITHQKGQSYLQFIQSIAERMDYEIYVDAENPSQVHFEESRSMTLNGIVELTWNKDLIDFTPRFKVWELKTEAKAEGRSRTARRRVAEVVAANEIDDDLHTAPGGDTPMHALEVRSQFFSAGSIPEKNVASISVSNLDASRAQKKAVSALRKSAREFLTADATTLGFTQLKPGIHINIKQMSAPFDGIYYVTKVVHTLDQTGYKSVCSLRRPGMLDPSDYPGSD
ncbi:hypothetical protein [Teredinibacter sp. KSP-S5-2]|uniref:phage late control D family protein n=1 Tax=Teredinibacter sp. KSP-S5-2 TaxID=3034506 RepID=UPI0029341959|nr:hypothetical protein [Teredinibacter sp. KSP-S5-2]WNO11496.1 hypothetical protein P5V12_09960 [Teredinibacter sp. KSP-S5-2]